jgi:hypothetical protein
VYKASNSANACFKTSAMAAASAGPARRIRVLDCIRPIPSTQFNPPQASANLQKF